MNKSILAGTASLVLAAGIVLAAVGAVKTLSNLPLSGDKAVAQWRQDNFLPAPEQQLAEADKNTLAQMLDTQRKQPRKQGLELLVSGIILQLAGSLLALISGRHAANIAA